MKDFKHSIMTPSVHSLENSSLSYNTDSSVVIKSLKTETLKVVLRTTSDNSKTQFGSLAHLGMFLKTQHRFIEQSLLMIVNC